MKPEKKLIKKKSLPNVDLPKSISHALEVIINNAAVQSTTAAAVLTI